MVDIISLIIFIEITTGQKIQHFVPNRPKDSNSTFSESKVMISVIWRLKQLLLIARYPERSFDQLKTVRDWPVMTIYCEGILIAIESLPLQFIEHYVASELVTFTKVGLIGLKVVATKWLHLELEEPGSNRAWKIYYC